MNPNALECICGATVHKSEVCFCVDCDRPLCETCYVNSLRGQCEPCEDTDFRDAEDGDPFDGDELIEPQDVETGSRFDPPYVRER